MTAFRFFLVVLWLAVATVTIWAVHDMGLVAALGTFLGDLNHPWRAQFYSDLEAHLLLFACWIVYRERSAGIGIAFAVATVLFGALFTLPYILVASFRAKGNVGTMLLGSRKQEGAKAFEERE